MIAQKKVRSWCDECEAWHPLGQHVAKKPDSGLELRAEPRIEPRLEARPEPRPAPLPVEKPRGSALLRLAMFLCVILPAGVVAWTAATYAVLLLWPHIKAALP